MGLGVAARAHGHVGRDRREAGGDLPYVEVVHLDHVVLRREQVADLLGIEAARRRLEQDAAGVAQQAVAGAQHQRGHEQGRDAVGAREVGDQDHRAGDRRGDEGEQVGEHVLEGALDVEAAPLGAGEHQRCREVHHDAQDRDQKDRQTVHVRRVDEAAHALQHDHQRERHERRAVELGGEDLGAPEAEGEVAAGGPPREPRGEQRQRDGTGVREHVGGVGQQRQRVGQHTGHDLHGHQPEDQDQGEGQAARVVRVDVPVVVVRHHADGRMLVCRGGLRVNAPL